MTSQTFPKRLHRTFCPADFRPDDWNSVEPLLNDLLERPIGSSQDLEQWILDGNELLSVLEEEEAIRYIRAACHTHIREYEEAFLHFISEIKPKLKPIWHKLHTRFLEEVERFPLPQERYHVFLRSIRTQVELFCEKNVPLQVEVAQLCQEYQKLCGSMTVNLDGKELTLSQASTYLQHPERKVRQQVWQLIQERRWQDREKLDELFSTLYEIRQKIAQNSGKANYRDYSFAKMERFDYTPQDCLRFHRAVEKRIVPLVHELQKRRQQALGVEELRPWDLSVDPHGRPQLKPFEKTEDLIRGCGEIFQRLDDEFYQQFSEMAALGLLDLENRKNKAPGGFQHSLEESRYPFIFMNAVGVHRDVEVLLHESGHAFHYYACCGDPIVVYRHAPIEFAEVASMAMELLASRHWDVFYSDEEDLLRARRENLEGVLTFFPWCATIDAFQHEIYTRPGEDVHKIWLSVLERFQGIESWQGLEKYRPYLWQRQLHLYEFPFYYIEYGLAQMGALQIWIRAKENLAEALEAYKKALRLGGSRPLKELYQTAGIELLFDEDKIARVAETVMAEIDRLDRELSRS